MASPWTLDEWLSHQSQVHPLTIDLGLERMRSVLQRLNWQAPEAEVITVAGTNGKGSVTAYSASILQAAGYRVGTFTSPHLIDYRERIRLDGEWVSEAALVAAFERIELARLRAPVIPLTFFEYNALAAFLILAAARLDAWILEVGLGGRLDAVNVIDPDVAVIVSIGLDHQEFLGDTLERIGAEKAGILRRDVPAVLGSRDMPQSIERSAQAIGALLKRPERDYRYAIQGTEWDFRGRRWDLLRLPAPALLGDTQFANAATAIAALEELPLAVPPAAIARGLTEVRLAGRFQVVGGAGDAPQWILDVAHNPDSAHVLALNLRARRAAGRTFAVCAVLADKDLGGIVQPLAECFDEWFTPTLDGARGLEGAEMARRLIELGVRSVHVQESVAQACAAALRAAASPDRIVVFGSFHTVGPALEWLRSQQLLPRGALT